MRNIVEYSGERRKHPKETADILEWQRDALRLEMGEPRGRNTMGYHPRIECKKVTTFQTTRSRCSELWFVNNKELEHEIPNFFSQGPRARPINFRESLQFLVATSRLRALPERIVGGNYSRTT